MKKISRALLLIALCGVFAFALVGCGIFGGGDVEDPWKEDPWKEDPWKEDPNNITGFNVNAFKNLSVDLTGVASLGLAEAKGVTSGFTEPEQAQETQEAKANGKGSVAALSSKIKPMADTGNNRSFLFAFDEDGNPSVVQFIKKTGVGEDGEEVVTQEEIKGEIDKLYISGDFIYIRYKASFVNWWNWERDTDPNYDKTNYMCGYEFQSFVIYKPTGKVYALADAAGGATVVRNAGERDEFVEYNNYTFEIEDGNVVSYFDHAAGGNKKYMKLTVSGDNLTATNLIPNPSIQVEKILFDKNGNTFVKIVGGTSAKIDSTVYTRSDIYKGDDGLVYELSYTQPSQANLYRELYKVRYYNEDLVLTDIADDTKVYLQGRNYWEGGWLINGKFLFRLSWNQMQIFYNATGEYEHWRIIHGFSENSNGSSSLLVAHGEVFALLDEGGDAKALKHFDLGEIEEPEIDYYYRNQGYWNYSNWIPESTNGGAWDRAGEEPVYVPGYTQYYFEDGTIFEYGDRFGWLEWVYHPAGNHYEAKNGQERAGEKVNERYIQPCYKYGDGTVANWVGGTFIPGHYETETFIPQFSETDPEWNYYSIGGGEWTFSNMTTVAEATSAYIQGNELYAVADSIFAREVSIIVWDDEDEKYVANSSSSDTFTGTVITMLPLN